MTALRLGSLFDGIGVFPLAAVRCGIEPVWASEIEKAPISITKRHFPNMAHLGDVTKLDGREIPPVHIITFGSPCQNLSQIGNRKGLAGEKSSLFFQAIRIIREMREATNGLSSHCSSPCPQMPSKRSSRWLHSSQPKPAATIGRPLVSSPPAVRADAAETAAFCGRRFLASIRINT